MGSFIRRMTVRTIVFTATLLGMMYLLNQADKETKNTNTVKAEPVACTMEEYRQKVQNVQHAMRSLQSGDIAIYQQAVAKMQETSRRLAENPNDLMVACQGVDEVLAVLPQQN